MIALQSYAISHDTQLIQIYLMELMIAMSVIYFAGILQLRYAVFIYILGFSIWIFTICSRYSFLTIESYSFILELVAFVTLHIFMYHSKEMTERRLHNTDKIMDVEIKRTNDLLSNLVPPPVLLGIKND